MGDEVDLRAEFNRILLKAFGRVEKIRRDFPDDPHMNVSEDYYAGLLKAAVKKAGYICVGKGDKSHVRIPRWLYDALSKDAKELREIKGSSWKVTKAVSPSIDLSKYGKVSNE